MMMPGRKYQAGSGYRYGFNGKENDNEVKGEGNQQDYGMRIYDPRLGRFLSVDPLTSSYPWNSTYAFAENDVIRCSDLDGAERDVRTTSFYSNPQLNKTVADNYVCPDGMTCVGRTTKEIVAQALVSGLHIPTNGTFRYWEYPEHPEKNNASYYVSIDGQTHTFAFTTEVVKSFFDKLPEAQKNLSKVGNVVAAVANLAVAGVLAKAELKVATGELKAAASETKAATSVDVTNGKFAQPNHSNNFSLRGQKELGVKSIDQAAVNLKSGTWSASKLPIDYVVRDGQVYYLNTRSIATLTEAGIPKSQWVFKNRTGVEAFEKNLTNNLNGSSGYNEVTNRQTGKKTKL
jgi:RHS repeat-associated protein